MKVLSLLKHGQPFFLIILNYLLILLYGLFILLWVSLLSKGVFGSFFL